MGVVIEMSEELAKHDVCKENGTDDISSHRNDVVQHWDSLINLLGNKLNVPFVFQSILVEIYNSIYVRKLISCVCIMYIRVA